MTIAYTSPDNFPYPLVDARVVPLNEYFENLAKAAQTALTSRLLPKANLVGGNSFTGVQSFSGSLDLSGAGTIGTTGESGESNKILIRPSRGAGGVLVQSLAAVVTSPTLAVRGAVTQTGNLQEWQNSAGTASSWINNNGDYLSGASIKISGSIIAGSTGGVIGQLTAYATAPSVVGVAVRGAASQTADLQQWQNSAGAILSRVDSSGLVSFATDGWHRSSSDSRERFLFAANGRTSYRTASTHDFVNSSDQTTNRFDAAGGQSNLLTTASTIGLIIKGAASQTADLQQWQNSTGGAVAKVNSYGDLIAAAFFTDGGARVGTSTTSGRLSVGTSNPSQVAVSVRGAASQTADLQQWQNSAGSTVASVSASGVFTSANYLTGTGSPQGVVTAPVGALYTDTATTLGVSVWRKASGTGNTGWVVLDGDTGVRYVANALINGWAPFVPSYGPFLRRSGNQVSYNGYLNKNAAAGAATASQFLTIPAGFRPTARINGSALAAVGTGVSTPITAIPGSGFPIEMNYYSSFSTLHAWLMGLSWETNDPWPTTLPGTAA